MIDGLCAIPDQMRAGARAERADRRTSPSKFCDRENWLFLGRGYHYPVALEGALKLKEISYIHAEGMPAAEMKHGPIALINEGMPVVFIATKGMPVRQGHQQHRRSPSPRRPDHRRRHRRRHATSRRYSDHVIYVPDTLEAAAAAAERRPAATARLPRRRRPRLQRRQAAEPGEERDGGVNGPPVWPLEPQAFTPCRMLHFARWSVRASAHT